MFSHLSFQDIIVFTFSQQIFCVGPSGYFKEKCTHSDSIIKVNIYYTKINDEGFYHLSISF